MPIYYNSALPGQTPTNKSWVLSTGTDNKAFPITRITPSVPNATPGTDTARWTQISPLTWNATEGYTGVNTYAFDNNKLFSSLGAIPAISAGGTVYTEVGVWTVGTIDSTPSGEATIGPGSGGIEIIALEGAPQSGALPALNATAEPYRVTIAGNSTASNNVSEVLDLIVETQFGFRAMRFPPTYNGSLPVNLSSGGGTITIERQSTTQAVPTAAWNSAVLNVATNARYIVNFNNIQNYIDAHNTEKSGSFPTNITGTWRLQQVGGASITGPLTVINHADNNVRFRVGTASQMATAFGNVNISSGGDWQLIKTMNAQPENDPQNWLEETIQAWSAQSAFDINSIVSFTSIPVRYYRANTSIPSPAAASAAKMYVRRNDLLLDDRVMAWDTDRAGTNKGIWHSHIPAGTATLENGTVMRLENGQPLEFD